MKYDQDIIEEIRLSNDIVGVISEYVRLVQKGNDFFGLCPFHNEKTPSFHVRPERQMFYCFGCGASGNVISFIMQMENYSFVEALKFLADKAHINIDRNPVSPEENQKAEKRKLLQEIHQKAARFYYGLLKKHDIATHARQYIEKRGITKEFQTKCGLGYAAGNQVPLSSYLSSKGYSYDDLILTGLTIKSTKDGSYYDRFYGRLMFPIFDVSGNVIAFGGRALNDQNPKYLNSPETPIFDKSRNLYGLNFARLSKTREIIVVEGYMDALSLYQAGFSNVVAALGTSFTQNHARILRRYADSIIILFDSDEAGEKATLRAIPHLTSAGLTVKVAQTTDSKDPDEYIQKHGREKFSELLKDAKSHVAFEVFAARKKYDLEHNEGLISFTKEVSSIIGKIQNDVEKEVYLKEVSSMTGISVDSIKKEVEIAYQKSVKNPQVKNYTPLPYTQKKTQQTSLYPKGLLDAQKSLLNIFINSPSILIATKDHLESTEFSIEVYRKIFELLLEFYNTGKDFLPAELINYFDSPEEQKTVSDVINQNLDFLDASLKEKSVNDQIKKIKLHNIEKEIIRYGEENNAEMLILCHKKKRNISDLYITFTDG